MEFISFCMLFIFEKNVYNLIIIRRKRRSRRLIARIFLYNFYFSKKYYYYYFLWMSKNSSGVLFDYKHLYLNIKILIMKIFFLKNKT